MWYWIKRRGERPSIIDSLAFGGGALYCFGAGGIEAVSILGDSALAGMPIIALTALATWAGWRTGLRIF